MVIGSSERQLELPPQDRDRRAQLMAGIVDEAPLVGHRSLDPVQQRVGGARQLLDLVVAVGHHQPPPEFIDGYRRGLIGQSSHRAQRSTSQHPAGPGEQPDQHRTGEQQDDAKSFACPVIAIEGRANNQHVGTAVDLEGTRQQKARAAQVGHIGPEPARPGDSSQLVGREGRLRTGSPSAPDRRQCRRAAAPERTDHDSATDRSRRRPRRPGRRCGWPGRCPPRRAVRGRARRRADRPVRPGARPIRRRRPQPSDCATMTATGARAAT